MLAKHELLKVPLIGWTWYFLEIVFCKRKWEEDRKTVFKGLSDLKDYPEYMWVGTREAPLFVCVLLRVWKDSQFGSVIILLLHMRLQKHHIMYYCDHSTLTQSRSKLLREQSDTFLPDDMSSKLALKL